MAGQLDWSQASPDAQSLPSAKGGAHRPEPDRGTKRHLLVERHGTPLAVELSAANAHDSTVSDTLLDVVPAVRQPCSRLRKRPANKGYDYRKCCVALRQRGIKSRLARRGIESSERLGRR